MADGTDRAYRTNGGMLDAGYRMVDGDDEKGDALGPGKYFLVVFPELHPGL